MNKLFLTILLITLNITAQEKETVDLNWKISDTLVYKTVMKDVLLKKGTRESQKDSISEKISGIFKEMQEQMSNLKYETKLFPDKNGHVDIAMMLKKEKGDTTQTLFSGIAQINGNVLLRGKVSSQGELLSLYYKREQSNLISILFELPTRPIKVGDEWSLKVDMISMDQNFKADTIFKKNIVRLKDLKMRNGNKIAIIEYDIQEYVSGDFGVGMSPMILGDSADKKTFMKMSHKAIGEFDIEKGFWVLYDGIMDLETNFMPMSMGMGGKKRTEFKLTPEK